MEDRAKVRARQRRYRERNREEIRARDRERSRERYTERKAERVCTKCGGELDPGSTRYCPAHLEAARESDFLRVRL